MANNFFSRIWVFSLSLSVFTSFSYAMWQFLMDGIFYGNHLAWTYYSFEKARKFDINSIGEKIVKYVKREDLSPRI